MINIRALFVALMIFACSSVHAEIPVPPLTGHVIDQTSTLTADQLATLEQILQDFDAKEGSQVAVLIVPTTAPETIEQYSLRVAEQWKLGRKKIDDGAILLIAKNDHTLRIEVGYGLEGALTDATSKRIIAETITPLFKQGDFNTGITAGVEQILRVIEGESLPEPAIMGITNNVSPIHQYFPIIFIAVLVLGGLFRVIFGHVFGSIATGGIIAFLAWIFVGVLSIALIAGLIALLFTLLGSNMLGRNMLSGGFGGGGRGGFGGGGFGGGGGGFGGGGASGRW